ncbi:hypothetical protein Tco_0212864 [Tanacetum coccineum]
MNIKFRGGLLGFKDFKMILRVNTAQTLEEVFQDFQDTSESFDDDTNFVNKNQEPFVVNQDPGAHIGYNCPPKVLVISKPEPCNNQNVNELPQTLPSVHPTSCSGDENSSTYDSKPNFVDSSNVFNPPPQPSMYSYEICGNDAYYGYDCSPQVPFIYNPELFQPPQYPVIYHPPHETYQRQPMNEDYYHEQNSCYDPNSFGFDQLLPQPLPVIDPTPLEKGMEELRIAFQAWSESVRQKKEEEEKRIAEDQAAKDRYWKIPICYDDDEDEESSIPL